MELDRLGLEPIGRAFPAAKALDGRQVKQERQVGSQAPGRELLMCLTAATGSRRPPPW